MKKHLDEALRTTDAGGTCAAHKANCRLSLWLLVPLLVILSVAYGALGLRDVKQFADGSTTREIRLLGGALLDDGVGGYLSNLRGVLIIANATGAVVTADGRRTGGVHRYSVRQYLRLKWPLTDRRRICPVSTFQANAAVVKASDECEKYDPSAAQLLFKDCDTLLVSKYLRHPRTCTAFTAPLVRAFWKYSLPERRPQKDVCVLRRGGDVERFPESRIQHHFAIDVNNTLPILGEVRRRGRRVVVITETRRPQFVKRFYGASFLSDKEDINVVIERIAGCKCLFVASGSGFATAMVQLAQPAAVIYTVDREGFGFQNGPWIYKDYGNKALPVTAPANSLVKLCV